MATRFWVGGTTGTWDSTAGTKWATSSGGTGGASAPTSSDDVTFDGAAGGIGAGTITVAATAAAASVTVTGAAVKTTVFSFAASFTTAGAFTVNGNSATNRVLVQSSVVGTARTITAAAVSLSNVDFQDITGAGAAAPFTGTSIGDCGGLTQITPTTPATQTHTASAGGSWSDASKWTSRVPLPQDDVVVNASTTGTLTADMPRMGKSINFTGFAGVCTLGSDVTSYGSLTLASGMTVGGVFAWTFAGRSACSLTSAGKVFPQNLFVSAPGGTVTLQDALSGGYVVLLAGTFNTNNQGVTCTGLADNNSTAARTWTFGTSTVTLTGVAGANMMYATSSGCTMNAASATFVVSVASASTRAFVGAGFSYGTLRYTVASSPGSLTITGANTFGTLDIGPGRPLILPSSTTTTVTNMNAVGVPNGYTYLPGLAGQCLSVADSAANSITGDLDARVRVALDDWTPAANGTFFDKMDYANNNAWQLAILTDGRLFAYLSHDGVWANVQNAVSTVNLSATADGATLWVRMTYRASDGRIQFFTASGALTNPAAGDFTQLGADRTVTSGAIFDSSLALGIGDKAAVGTVYPLKGKLYRAQIRNGLDGTLVFDADLTAKTCGARTFTESSSNGATVTVNGSSAQAGDGCVVLAASTPGTFATLAKAGGGYVYGLDYLSISDIHAT